MPNKPLPMIGAIQCTQGKIVQAKINSPPVTRGPPAMAAPQSPSERVQHSALVGASKVLTGRETPLWLEII